MMGHGNVVALNGTSSAGKTSIAKALQEIMEAPYLHTGVDHFLPRLPAWCFAVSDGGGPVATDHVLLVYQGGGRAPTVDERTEGVAVSGDEALTRVRIGQGGIKLLAGMYRAVAATFVAGVDVIVDDVIHDRRVPAAVVDLRDAPVLIVGLRVPLAVAERRERERGDRGPGGAAAFYDLVHAHGGYDLGLKTVGESPTECAMRIKRALHDGHPRRAFQALAEALPR